MNRYRGKMRRFFLSLVLLLVIGIGIGYAFLSSNLRLNGSSGVGKGNWIIYFDRIQNQSGIVATNSKISLDKQTVSFNITITKPGDYYEFDVDTVNDGTIDAMIDSIELEGIDNNHEDIVSMDVVYKDDGSTLHKCDVLPKLSRRTITVKIKYTEDIKEQDLLDENENLNLKFKINYVQDTTCTRNPVLTINPNGGTYNGSRKIQDQEVEPNTTVLVDAPTYTGRQFKGYELSDETLLEIEKNGKTKVQVGENDLIIKATWDKKDYVARIVENNTYYETLQGAIDAASDNNTVELLRSTEEDPINNKNITVDLGTNVVFGTFTNDSGYTLTLKNGEVRSNNISFINNGILNLGTKDGEYQEDNIILRGEQKGLVQNGTFNFYDGYIIGSLGLIGGYSDVETNYYVYVENNTAKNYQKVYLTKNIARAVVMTKYKGDIYYNNLQNAIDVTTLDSLNDNVQDGYIMYAIRDFEAAYRVNLYDDDTVTFDLSGYNVETGYTFINGGVFTITDTLGNGSLIPSIPVENNNELNIVNATLKSSTSANIVENNKNLNLVGATIKSNDGYSVYNKSVGVVTLDENTVIDGDSYNFKNTSSVPQDYSAGTIYNLENSGNITLSEGILVSSKTNDYSVKNNGTINLRGGDVTGKNGITSSNQLNIVSGNITCNNLAVNNSGTVTLDGANITASTGIDNSGRLYGNKCDINASVGIYNRGTANLESNMSIVSTSSCVMSNGNTTVNGGSYTGTGYSIKTAGGTTTLNSGTFATNGSTVFGLEHGTLNFVGGNASGRSIGAVNYYGSFNMSGGTLTAPIGVTGEGSYYSGNSYTTISGGIINSTDIGVLADKNYAYYTVTGGTIKATSSNGIGIKNTNSSGKSSVTITDGDIIAGKYGAYNDEALLVIGQNNVEIKDVPNIRGELFGVYINSGTVNFYDGELKGKTNGHYGEVSETPTNSGVSQKTEEINDQTYIVHYIKVQNNWLKVGDDEFNSLNDACNAIDGEGTITVIADADVTFNQDFATNKNIIFDLNGHDVKLGKWLINNGTVEIIDSSNGKTGSLETLYEQGIENKSTLKLNEINLITSGTNGITNTGTLIIDKVNFETTSENAVYNKGGTITINDTDIETDNYAIKSVYRSGATGVVTVNNSNLISNTESAIYIESDRVVLNNTNVSGKVYGVFSKGGLVELNSGTVTGDERAVYGSGSYLQNGGTTTAEDIAIQSTGTVKITGGTVQSKTAITMMCSDYYSSVSHPVEVTGGQVIGTVNEAIKIKYAVAKITGGTVKSEAGNAIYSEGYVEIGDNSTEILDTPIIQGYDYAIYNNDSRFYTYFFDGILKGKTETNNGLIDRVPDGTKIQEGEEEVEEVVYQTKTLIPFGNFLRVNGVEYNSFKKASDAIGLYEDNNGNIIGNEGTIEVIADAYVNFESILPEHKKITLDLRGHTLVMTQPLETKGINSIIDSSNSQNGLITNVKTNAVKSNGYLTIYGGSYKSETDYALYVDSKTTTLEGGRFTYKKSIYAGSGSKLIVNNAYINLTDEIGIDGYEATVTVNGGDIHSDNNYGINSFRSTLNINGGNISSKNKTAVIATGFGLNVTGGTVHSEKDYGITATELGATISGGDIISDQKAGLYIGSSTIASTSLNVSGGNFTGKTYGMHIHGSSTSFDISGGTATGETYGINLSARRGTISNVTANGGITGIYHTDGKLTMIGGTAKGDAQYGIYNSSELVLGVQDRNVDISKPLVQGKLYGLYTNGTVDFYDGILKGQSFGYFGNFSNIEVATQIWNDTEVQDEVTLKTTFLIEEREIAENTRTHEKFNNLEEALNTNIETGDVIKLINNAPIYYPVTIGSSVDATLDMDGYSISTNRIITNNGKLNIVNNNNLKESSIKTSTNINLITNTNVMSLDNINVSNTSSSNYIFTNRGTLSLTDSNINGIKGITSNNNLSLLNTNVIVTSTTVDNSGVLSVEGGELKGSTVVYSSTGSNKDITIKNTKLLGTSTSLYCSSSNNEVEIYNVEMTGNLTTSGSTSNVSIDHLTLVGNYSNSSVTTLSNSNLTTTLKSNYSPAKLYFVSSSNKLDIDTVVMNANTLSNVENYGIYLSGSATSEISNLELNIEGIGTNYGLYLKDNDNVMTLTNGEVDVKGTNTYGVYINKGEFTLGVSDSEKEKEDKVISTTDPLISSVGTTSGIGVKKDNGLFKYYDGKIIGSTRSKPDTTTVVEEGYEASIYMDSTTGYEYCILENLEDGYQAVARMNGIYYNTIQEAVNNAKTGSVITILKNTIEDVSNTKNITIDLNNHRVTGKYINRGTTRLINGSLYNSSEVTVQNTGTLILGEDDSNVSIGNVSVLNENYTAISQSGRLIIYDGFVQGRTSINGSVTLTPNGYVAKTEQTKEIDPDTEEEVVVNEKTYLISVSQMDDDEEKPTYSFMVTIDPNGGLYKGISDVEENFLLQGETLEITVDPEREGYTFDHWEEVSDTHAFENGVVTVTDSNVELRAVWNVTENVVAKVGDNYYLTLNKAYDAAINGDRIELIKDVTENLTNDKIISLDLGGHKITGTITNNGTLNIDNGRIENLEDTPVVNNGTLNMGVDEGQMSTSSIVIFGGDYGLDQNGIFNFYDGMIEGQTAIDGSYNKGAAGYYLYVDRDNENNCQKVYLIKNSTQAVARVVNGGDYFFSSLKDAINATDNLHPTVYLLADIESSYPIVVPENRKLEIDLDGHILINGPAITNTGELSLVDSGNITKGKLRLSNPIENTGNLKLDNIVVNVDSNSINIINNSGNITIEKSTLTAVNGYVLNNSSSGNIILDNETVFTSSNFAINNTATGEVVIDGGTIVGVKNTGANLTLKDNIISSASDKNAISNGIGSLTLTGVSVTSSATVAAVYNDGGTLTINSGNYTASKRNTVYNNSGTLNINGGTFTNTSNDYTVVFCNTGTANVSGGSFTVTGTVSVISSFRVNNATATITGGTFSATRSNAAAISTGGTLTIENATINSEGGLGIYTTGGTLTINDATITSNTNYTLYLDSSSSTVNFNGGTIYSQNNNPVHLVNGTLIVNNGIITSEAYDYSAILQNGGTYIQNGGTIISKAGCGVRVNGTSTILGGNVIAGMYGINQIGGTLTLGSNDGNVSQEVPRIIGETYGYNRTDGTFNFYDGIFLGKTGGLSVQPTNLPRRYQVGVGDESVVDETTLETNVYNTAFLEAKTDFVQVGDNTYNDLQDAIDAVGTTGTMKLIADATVIGESTIPSTKTITFDLNNHSLTLTNKIINNGTLTIDDNSDDKGGALTNNSTILIQSDKSLTIDRGVFTSKTNTVKVLGGTFVMNGGTINGSTQHAALYAKNATATINGGTVNSNGGYSGVAFEDGAVATINNITVTGTNVNGCGLNVSNANVTIKNANVSTTGNEAVYTSGGSSILNIEGGTFSSNNQALYVDGGQANVTGGSFSSTGSNTVYLNGGTTTIDGESVTISGSASSNSTICNNYGTLNFRNGIVTSTHSNGIYNNRTTTVSGGTITSYDVSIYNDSNITVTGGEFTSTNTLAVYNTSTITITGGEFTSNSATAIYNKQGTITIGVSDSTIDITSPVAKGNTYGLYIESGTANVYDGIFEGKTLGYSGTISSMPENYNMGEGEDGDYKTAYLEIQSTFVKVGNEYFNSLQDAINAIDTTGTMILVRDATTTDETTIPSGKNITFELNGKSLTLTKTITNNGTLTVEDNSQLGSGTLINENAEIFTTPGTIIINGGTYYNQSHFVFSENGNVTINNCTVNSSSPYSDVYVKKGTITINGGTFNTTGYATLKFVSNTTATINDITINAVNNAYGLYNDSSTVTIYDATMDAKGAYTIYGVGGTLTIKDGTFTNSGTKEVIVSNSTLVVEDGVFNCAEENFIYTTGGRVTISGGDFTSVDTANGFYNGGATVTITGGTFKCGSNQYASFNNSSGTANIEGGTFISSGKGIENSSTLNLKGGTITANGYGLYQSTGTSNIGIKDGNISTSLPTVTGGSYGLYIGNGTINFYDGILKGKTNAYYGSIANIEDSSFIKLEDQLIGEDTYKTAYLAIQSDIIQNDATKEKFNNIQTAIDEAASGEKLILLDDVILYYSVTVPDKEIILDMDGHTITVNKTITNNGTLNIIDDSNDKTGEIKTTSNINLIENNLNLDVKDIKLSSSNTSLYMVSNNVSGTFKADNVVFSANYSLYNYDKATIDNSTITGNYGIRNQNTSGSLELNNTNIATKYWCIYNYGSNFTISGGTYNSTNGSDYAIYMGSTSSNPSVITNEAVITRNSGNVIQTNGTLTLNVDNSTINGDISNSSGATINFDSANINKRIVNKGTVNMDSSTVSYTTTTASDITLIDNQGTIKIEDSDVSIIRTNGRSYGLTALLNSGNATINNTDIDNINDSGAVGAGTYYGINNSGTLNYKKGTITLENAKIAYGIKHTAGTSTLSLTGMNIGSSDTSYGIHQSAGTVTLKKGELLINSDTTSYGVYVSGGTLVFGIYDGSGFAAADVSITEPEVRAIGTTTGIGVKKVDGSFNYYDGRIVGSTASKPEAPSDVEPNYQVVNYTENDTNYPYCILECLTPDDGSIDYDWRVNVDDEDSVYTKTITTDNLVWKDNLGNTYTEPAEGRYAEYRVSIFQRELTKNFIYTVEATLGNGVPITVTHDNETGLFALSDTVYKKDVITFTSGNISDYSNMNKTINLKVTTSSTLPDSEEYSYSGEEKVFVAPKTGIYLLETWGAQGGDAGEYAGGYGGYSTGKVYLNAGDVLYINVGGKGGTNPRTIETVAGGYNGGGSSYRNNNGDGEGSYRGSGGGATSIATKSGLLSTFQDSRDSILIVSGGGGGASSWSNHYGIAGSGGGIEGTDGQLVYGDGTAGTGATQTSGGNFGGVFGQGGNAIAEPGWGQSGGPGGGGGYYGGSYGKNNAGAGGGSGYIGNSELTDKHMVCYNCETSNDEDTLTLSNEEVSEEPLIDKSKIGDGYAKITFVESYEEEFDYTGSSQVFTVPATGYYKLETWGAQGGSTQQNIGGKGSYVSGEIFLSKGEKLYIYVGGSNGYNGGGSLSGETEYSTVGGGATDIRLVNGSWDNSNSLASRIIVAGAGGGAYSYPQGNYLFDGGAAGTLVGKSGSAYNTCTSTGGTQTLGGSCSSSSSVAGLFGKGGSPTFGRASGGGSGYYGGAARYDASGSGSGAGGGSSYISGYTGCVAIKSESDLSPKDGCVDGTSDVKCSYHYSGKIFRNTSMIAGDENMISPNGSSETGHSGNGYARITYIESYSEEFDYTGDEQVYTVPETGYYKLETWGASGGDYNATDRNGYSTNQIGGYGGYSTGKVYLEKGEILYINIGGKGESIVANSSNYHQNGALGGYNGGGNGGNGCSNGFPGGSGGGGATSIAKESGLLKTLENKKDSILIVSGGAGGAGWVSKGGSGGGYKGESLNITRPATGGTQTSGYAFGEGSPGYTGYNVSSSAEGSSGSGGGFYGGQTYNVDQYATEKSTGGAGGSGYIGNSDLFDKHMMCYNCTISNEGSTLTLSNNNYSATPLVDTPKKGNGYAKITYVSNATYVLDDLILYFDGKNSGDTSGVWQDLSGLHNDGTIVGGATFDSESLVLDGNDDGVYLENKLQDLLKGDFTIQTTLLFNGSGNDYRDVIIGNYSSSNSNNSVNIERGSSSGKSSKLKSRFYFKGGDNDYLTGNMFELNKKINVAYVFEKSSKKFSVYYNGVLFDTNTYNNYTDLFDYNSVYIGRDGRTGNTSLSGNIYSFSIYNKALSSDDILENYNYDLNRYINN